MEITMAHRHLPYEPTSEDRVTLANWKRGTAIVYGCALLLLIAWIVMPRTLVEPSTETVVADGPAKVTSHIARTTNITRRD
jgi:hypothetical protein